MGIFRRFWSSEDGRKGNAAILFALSLVPIVGATGAAVDYSLANSARASMQKALDSTALALAKLMPLTQGQLDTQGWQIFQASLGTIAVPMQPSDLVITTPGTGKLVLNVQGQYQTRISSVIGVNNFPVGARAEVTWGIKKLEVALALDNTGSMSSNNKMTELKKASHNLLNILEKAAKNPGDVKVSIIPFHVQTKVGTSHLNASWLRWDIWESENGSCNKSGYNSQSSCTNQKVCTIPQYTSQSTCQNNGGSWVNATWTPANRSTWTGCVEDRNQNYDALDTAPTTTETRFPAIQCSYSLAEIMPLTYTWADLHTRIDAMNPDGNTNVTIGLAWAWHSLTQQEPMTQAAAPAPDLSKYIILLTDGDNTQNRWGGNSGGAIDNRTAAACTNAKAAGFRIYTIRVINGNATLLRNCATDPSMYFDVDSASELESVFNAIGGQLASLHLSQ
ncbi:MAG: VWA domain-containing protein [Xanthobacteraceae bacterium]|nr:VWA domain-containing protein [Xanthobacteraceae bacterium]